tara:strand:- start:268 stop:933 length:666 start_codon:yes stop_codon:yes gene_type:complete
MVKDNNKKIILHLCANTLVGSDSHYYNLDDDYEVIHIGEEVGVENYHPPENVYGVLANPVCTEFSTVAGFDKDFDLESGMVIVNHCFRIILEAQASSKSFKFWSMENPARGKLKSVIGKPTYIYQPWWFLGSPWTKETALWGVFNKPKRDFDNIEDVKQITELWIRPGRKIACLTYLHKSAVKYMPAYDWCKDVILAEKSDNGIRSMCSDGFARSFYLANK